MKEEPREEVFILVDDEEDNEVQISIAHEETNPQQPHGNKNNDNYGKEENGFQQRDNPFRTYKRKSRNLPGTQEEVIEIQKVDLA